MNTILNVLGPAKNSNPEDGLLVGGVDDGPNVMDEDDKGDDKDRDNNDSKSDDKDDKKDSEENEDASDGSADGTRSELDGNDVSGDYKVRVICVYCVPTKEP